MNDNQHDTEGLKMEGVKTGDVLACSKCGVELEVKKSCGCSDCEIICCGKPMELKQKQGGCSCCCC